MSPRLPTDFSDAEEFGALPEEQNPYFCHVTDVGEVQESDKGTLYVNAEFTVAEGEYAERKIWRNLPITGPGAGFYIDFVRKSMHDMDLSREEIAEIPTEELINRTVDVVVTPEEYPEGSGEMRNRVVRLLIPEE